MKRVSIYASAFIQLTTVVLKVSYKLIRKYPNSESFLTLMSFTET